MSALSLTLRVGGQLLLRHHRAEMVRSPARMQEVEALLREVRSVELRRSASSQSLPYPPPQGPYIDCLMVCVDRSTDRVVGVMRGTMGPLLRERPELAPAFRFDLSQVPDALVAQSAYPHQFALLPLARGGAAATTLVLALFREAYAGAPSQGARGAVPRRPRRPASSPRNLRSATASRDPGRSWGAQEPAAFSAGPSDPLWSNGA